MNMFWDSFDCEIQCEEFYRNDSEYRRYNRKTSSREDMDYLDAHLEVYLDFNSQLNY